MSPASAPIVACLGGPGSFSEEASRRFLPVCSPILIDDFAIAAVRALLGHRELRVISEAPLDIRLHLCAGAQSTLAQIDTVASHPAALAQSERFLGRQSWRRMNLASTAEAARMMAADADPARACLASAAAASLYGLSILARDVQDDADNHTTFAIIERRDQFA